MMCQGADERRERSKVVLCWVCRRSHTHATLVSRDRHNDEVSRLEIDDSYNHGARGHRVIE